MAWLWDSPGGQRPPASAVIATMAVCAVTATFATMATTAAVPQALPQLAQEQ